MTDITPGHPADCDCEGTGELHRETVPGGYWAVECPGRDELVQVIRSTRYELPNPFLNGPPVPCRVALSNEGADAILAALSEHGYTVVPTAELDALRDVARAAVRLDSYAVQDAVDRLPATARARLGEGT
jgi:hypothetical protein